MIYGSATPRLGHGCQEPVDEDLHETNFDSKIVCVKIQDRRFSCPLRLKLGVAPTENLFKNMANQNAHWLIGSQLTHVWRLEEVDEVNGVRHGRGREAK